MNEAVYQSPAPTNEPVLNYAPGDRARHELTGELQRQRNLRQEIPLVIGGERIKGTKKIQAIEPHAHAKILADVHQADASHAAKAVDAALKASGGWAGMEWQDRAAIFLKAADLLAGKYRARMNAATMLGQSKTAHQAEIDSACELIDFWRWNVHFLQKIYVDQPVSSPGTWNRMEYRPLEGFVTAITPFNFTSIAGNLPTAPALLGNTVVWKPAATAMPSAYVIMEILEEAGLPPGVINFLPGPSSLVAPVLLRHPALAGLHFTGSTSVFQEIWKTVGNQIEKYRTYPRLVGETGGKDFVIAHESADAVAVATALTRGAFEYQGQKCSAASRAYISKSLWPKVRDTMQAQLSEIRMGDVTDFKNFLGAVIDKNSFTKLSGAIDRAKASPECKIVAGGTYSSDVGYFVAPTVIETTNPQYETMHEELFGPVLTVYVYDDHKFAETLAVVDGTSPYALTGAIFAQDRGIVTQAMNVLRHAAGNFYINDKPTGAIVGQQPFGGARASGTNDKAGSVLNLLRWTSPRTIKETFAPATDYKYPFLG